MARNERPPESAPRERPASGPRWPLWVGNGLGLLFLALAVLTALGLWPPALQGAEGGVLLQWWVQVWRRLLGWGAWMVPLALARVGLAVLQVSAGEPLRWRWTRWLAWELAFFAALALFSLARGTDLVRALQGYDGGLVGWALAFTLTRWLPESVVALMWMALLVFGIAVGSGLWGWVIGLLRRGLEAPDPLLDLEPQAPPTARPEPDAEPREQEQVEEKPAPRPRRASKRARGERKPPASSSPEPQDEAPRPEGLPPLDLLEPEAQERPDTPYLEETARRIEEVLAEFGVPVRVVGVQVGPTVIQFAVEPGYIERTAPEGEVQRQRVRVARIVALRRDLALALAVKRLRIQAPVPGRPYVGIEIPNPKAARVRLRPLLASPEFRQLQGSLAVAVGRNVAGDVVVADLATMPHLLIAGTTGSGKSVFLKALLLCLVMQHTPETLRLILIDPKRVELTQLQELPHLLGPVEVEPQRIQGVLQWVVAEMQRRYRLFEKTRVRDIQAYHRLQERGRAPEPMPFLVVVIDELADLMTQAPEQTEFALVRLAQLARATGIHLVVATQRPSVDVVTGLIKANFPARIAFQVASSVDSRVILDQPGAEALLGRGDMLFLPPDAPAPLRVQGPYVSEEEIRRVVAFWQAHGGAPASAGPWEGLVSGDQEGEGGLWDPLLEEAARIVIQTQQAYTSLLQRRLRIGYPRAARLMEQLERLGIVSPAGEGRRERVVLVDPDTPFHLGQMKASRTPETPENGPAPGRESA